MCGCRDEQLLLEAAGFIAPVISSLVTKAADSIQFSVSSAVMDRAFEAFTELPEFKFDQANEAVRKVLDCLLVWTVCRCCPCFVKLVLSACTFTRKTV